VGRREVYRNILHVMYHIMKEGVSGLYHNLRPSCIKVMPTADISFMCYESLKKILVEGEEEVERGDDKEKSHDWCAHIEHFCVQ
jgi:hypothetical protein